MNSCKNLKPIFDWKLGSHWEPNANKMDTINNQHDMCMNHIPLARVGSARLGVGSAKLGVGSTELSVGFLEPNMLVSPTRNCSHWAVTFV